MSHLHQHRNSEVAGGHLNDQLNVDMKGGHLNINQDSTDRWDSLFTDLKG
jgi:hypothetical protein